MDQQALGDALTAVIGSGHALLHQLRLDCLAGSSPEARVALKEATSRLMDVINESQEDLQSLTVAGEEQAAITHIKERIEKSLGVIKTTSEPDVETLGAARHDSVTALRNETPVQEERKESLSSFTITNSSIAPEPIIIIGAGIGGLCLAQGLKKAGRYFRVFERDGSLHDRPQGYRLKIERNGAEALKATLTDACFEAFKAACAITTHGQTDYNPVNGIMTKSRSGSGLAGQQGLSATYTVDRGVFRRILMTGIADHITFGKELLSYDLLKDGGNVLATFKDGSRVQGRFLVGADGVRSSVRKQMLPEVRYVDTGAICIYGKTPITPALEAKFPAKALRWMTTFVDYAPSIQSILIGDSPLTLLLEPIRFSQQSRAAMRLPDDYVYWTMIGRKELFTDSTSTDARLALEAAKLSLELTNEWHESMNILLKLQDFSQCSAVSVVSAKPDIPSWLPSDRVTLLGDAIHAMSPCGGVGANTALVDAAEIAKLFGGPNCGIDPTAEAVGHYEGSMRKRALGMIMRSYAGSKKMFGQRAFGECPTLDS